MKTDTDPIEQLLWAVEALKAEGMSKQQVFAVVAKAVDDVFPTPTEGSTSQLGNRERPRLQGFKMPPFGKDLKCL